MREKIIRQLRARPEFVVKLVVFGVAANGAIILWTTLISQLLFRHRPGYGDVTVGVPLVIGLTLLYLSSLLARRKRAAWTITILVYTFILGLNLLQITMLADDYQLTAFNVLRSFILPLVILGGLVLTRDEFQVKSDIQSFTLSLRLIVILFFVTLLYGVAGFQLMDNSDFHQELSLSSSLHYTIDQFGLTNSELVPYTKRAHIFLDSLSIVSLGAITYAVISLFQPLRARFADQTPNRILMQELLEKNPDSSEDFFKLWPHDKFYFFNEHQNAGLAFHVSRGVALVVGDPAGNDHQFGQLLNEFDELCRVNDWQPVYVHTEPNFSHLYESHDFTLQKIGEEAVVNVHNFQKNVAHEKYFRQINNRFTKQSFTTELLIPPHNDAVIARLRTVSNEWLQRPGRAERRLLLGYFSADYMQQCPIFVARDAASTIQAFVNQIPSFDKSEANFDLLRSSSESPGNINDFLLMHFIAELQKQGFERLNLGLAPLAGMDNEDDNSTLIDGAMRFMYANGDRFYSFSGLNRFKAKYEPEWSDRYVAYRGGFRGFTKAMNALNRSMKVPKHLLHQHGAKQR